MSSNGILWITAVVMLAGGGAILATGKRRTPTESFLTLTHGIVPIIAACLYFAMATGQGLVALPTDQAVANGIGPLRIFYYGRYVDWAFTTPLLLLCLGVTAVRHGVKRPDLLAGAVLSDLLMIGTAFAFAASEVGWMKWTWFLISCVAFLGVYYVIWAPQAQANAGQRADVRSAYQRNASILSALWFAYPVVLGLAPEGLHLFGDTLAVLLIAVLDVISKVAYGLMATAADGKITERDLNETPAGMRVTV